MQVMTMIVLLVHARCMLLYCRKQGFSCEGPLHAAAQIIEYLNAYVERFRFREHLIFRTEVISVLQLQSGQYLVSTKVSARPCCCTCKCAFQHANACVADTVQVACRVTADRSNVYCFVVPSQDLESGAVTQRQYASVLVANGHHWDPAWPQLPGSFSGELLHSHAYRSPRPLAGKRVLVIGAGNSGSPSMIHSSACPQANNEIFHAPGKTFCVLPCGYHGCRHTPGCPHGCSHTSRLPALVHSCHEPYR